MTDHEEFDQSPYDEEETARQVAGLIDLLPDRHCRVLDIGCGDGRIAGPLLASAGPGRIELVGVDSDRSVETAFEATSHGAAGFQIGDLRQAESLPDGPFDLVLVLGNLLMTVREPRVLRDCLRGIADRMTVGGSLVVDDFAEGGWAELAAGRWADGIDESGSVQMVWLPGDPEFVVRMGDDVDPSSTTPRPDERVLRLWSRRELDDAAERVGLNRATHLPDHLLSVHRRSEP
ncbi:MAG: methyltransferase domain-containing protein [Phycisphaera sp.]|nr:methyltransferase domain-containing protein [Phycisphaera sp.]